MWKVNCESCNGFLIDREENECRTLPRTFWPARFGHGRFGQLKVCKVGRFGQIPFDILGPINPDRSIVGKES